MPKISRSSEVIRQALTELGVEADKDDVRGRAFEIDPNLQKDSDFLDNFSARCAQQRTILRKRGVPAEAPEPAAPAAASAASSERFDIADRFWTITGGNTQHADQILAFLEQVDAETLRASYNAFKAIVAKAGTADKAREIIRVMKQTGLID